MVGIPRSKACYGCRARRKKCDEKQPACGLCVKRGIQCVYRSALNIVFVDPASKKSPVEAEDSGYGSPGSPSNASICEMPQSAMAMVNRSQLQGSFLCAYLPGCAKSFSMLPSVVDGARQTGWLYHTYDVASTDELLSDSLHALCLAHFSQNGQGALMNDSRAVYGKAMRGLAKRLSQPDGAFADSTLAAAMILISYEAETAFSGEPNRWFDHVRGVLALVEARGKRNFLTEYGELMFDATRMYEVINSIAKRKAVDQRGLILQSTSCSMGGFFAQLCGITQSMASILELGDIIRRDMDKLSDVELKKKVSTLAYTFQDFDARLDSWQSRLEMDQTRITGDSTLWWEEQSQLALALSLDDPARVYDTFLCFKTLDIAQFMLMKWSTALLVNCFCVITEKALQEKGSDISIHSTDTERNQMHAKTFALATDLTKSFEYFLHPDCGLVAIDLLGFPLNAAYGFWNARHAKETQWFPLLFKRLKEISPGFGGIAESMAGLGGGGKGFREFFLREQGASAMPADARIPDT